jgi:hypothetical protein
MKQKDTYTLEELYANLDISLSKLSKIAGVTEATLTRIHDGYSARRETINKLLKAFSEVYGLELSQDNVTGIILEDKKAIRKQMLAHKGITEKAPVLPVNTQTTEAIPQTEDLQNRSTERKKTGIPDDLPQGTVKLADFVAKYELPESSFSRWIKNGLKGEHIKTTPRQITSGRGVQHYLTPAQQGQALEVLKRHGKLKTPEPEQKQNEEPAWYLPD